MASSRWEQLYFTIFFKCLILVFPKKRLVCIAPWLINSCLSIIIETGIFVSLELRIDEVDAAVDRRIARSLIFGVFIGNLTLNFPLYQKH